jgi:hypothetical protein
MDVSIELDRIFPVPLTEDRLEQAKDELFKFLAGLSKEEYETSLVLLPDKPKLEFEATEQIQNGVLTNTKEVFWDAVAYFAINFYHEHASTTDIISHLLKRIKGKPGNGLRKLAGKLSSRIRFSLFEQLLSLEEKDAKGRPLTQGEFEDYLESKFGRQRIGMMEYVIEEVLDTYKNTNKKNKNRGTITGYFEQHILARIQQKRRSEFKARLGKIDSVNKARFAAEEVRRELYVYPTFDPEYVAELCASVYNWYDSSRAHQKVIKNPSVLQYSYFFDEFVGFARRIRLAVSNGVTDISDFLRPQWDYVIAKFLPSESFWQSIQGLNGEVPLEQTEAGRNIASYRSWAKVAGAVYLAVVLLPVVVAVGSRVPGAVVTALRWAGGRLLLGTQYVYTTIRVFGVSAGAQRIVADVYHFYLQNPVSINQIVTTGTEVILDLTGSGTGMAPGSSPADISAAATAQIGKIAKTGISKLADEAVDVARGAEADIEFVEMVVKGSDDNYYRITALVKNGDENIMKLKVDKYENLGKQIDVDTQKKIMLQSKPRNDNSIADARGTVMQVDESEKAAAAASDVNVQQLKATGSDASVATMGPKTTGSGKQAVVGKATSTVDSGASQAGRNTSNNGAGSLNRLSGATSKKPPKLTIDLSKAGAMQKLVNANPSAEDLVNVLKDPGLFKIFKNSLQTSKAGAIQAANDLTELGNVIARFTVRKKNGVVTAERFVSDAVWSLPEHLRGVLIEHSLSPTQYQGWFRAGQLHGGFFPDVDYSLLKQGLDQRASLKTVSPFAKGYEKQLTETLPAHLESLVTGTKNGRARGYKITALLDVRMPQGSDIARADLLKTLKDLIPKDVKDFVAAVVDEF